MEEASETATAAAWETKRIQPEQATNLQKTEAKKRVQSYHEPDTLEQLIGKMMGDVTITEDTSSSTRNTRSGQIPRTMQTMSKATTNRPTTTTKRTGETLIEEDTGTGKRKAREIQEAAYEKTRNIMTRKTKPIEKTQREKLQPEKKREEDNTQRPAEENNKNMTYMNQTHTLGRTIAKMADGEITMGKCRAEHE